MKKICLLLIPAVLSIACQKTKSSGCFVGLRLTPKDSTPVVGDSLAIYANQINLMYQWSGPGGFWYQSTSGENDIVIPQVRIDQSGWYYCTASIPDCKSYTDSVYIRVQYAQGTPSCTLSNNQITSTAGIPDFNAALVTKSYNLSYSAIAMQASDLGSLQYDFVFNSDIGNNEPKDGIYYTTDVPIFDSQQDANVIFMDCIYGIYYFSSLPGQKVYVSHVNGKLRISFCSIKADDSSGANGLFTGQLTQQ